MSSTNSGTNDDDDRFTITARDLLQANATIIAGVLIFVSLSVSLSNEFDRPLSIYGVITVNLGIIPFVWACHYLVEDYNDRTYGYRWARRITRIGLTYLIGTVVFFLALSQYSPDTNHDETRTPTTTTNSTNTTAVSPAVTNTTTAAASAAAAAVTTAAYSDS